MAGLILRLAATLAKRRRLEAQQAIDALLAVPRPDFERAEELLAAIGRLRAAKWRERFLSLRLRQIEHDHRLPDPTTAGHEGGIAKAGGPCDGLPGRGDPTRLPVDAEGDHPEPAA